ncbi:MAG: GNAT family N-acetyltransferase [Acidimicrobiaceae bacterium]|nr:GNAT family N-acetyltransferase [Acidimicrobiaceae bacterium]MXZ97986.1 GNAT family N-acetyltransferase [Acidimicrobiaceae bacterium]MYE75003.1 GNAT family N-acetyltransferase [Acidimicrobiaceae bacterium]MYE96558.1 GNAT family N-acetyltransferase [Acidimicrobiaceae bacterium]MYH43418.1 GNAT family N-acetyltransferase [Acidimicrobiaceae bacterium]
MRIVDARSLDTAEFAAALEFQQRMDRERDPGLPVTPAAELRATFDDDATDHCRHQRIVAFADGSTAAAIGHVELNTDAANANLAGVEITPTAASTAAAVLAELLRRARDDGRTSAIAWGDHTPAAHTFWTGLGAELRYTEQESRLEMAAVDPQLMAQWIAAGPADLELVHWARHCPEDRIDALVATANAMNDAPTDDLEIADTVVDAAMVRAEIEARAARGLEYHGVLAVTAGGEAAGATEVFVNRHRPAVSWQWSTVVLPAHRGRGIGRWVKAAMWQRLRAAEPEVTALQTGNAASNAHMLAINIEMGFVPAHLMGCWQADLDVLESRLG